MAPLKLGVLIEGEPGLLALWTLRALSSLGELRVVRSQAASPARRRGSLLLSLLEAVDERRLDALCAGEELRAWWREAPRAAAELSPDFVIEAASGRVAPELFGPARLGALGLRHGGAPLSFARWSAHRAVVENRPDLIAAAVVSLPDGAVLWRGAPQLAPGDGGVELLFRAHVEATGALVGLLGQCAEGRKPKALGAPLEAPARRGPLDLGEWARYLRVRRGRGARFILERGIAC